MQKKMCTNPLKGFPNGETAKGKINYIICSKFVNHIEISNYGTIIRCYDDFVSSGASKVISHYIDIPCGQCLECRLEYSRQWANRCILEAKQHKDNCFITLTYNDSSIPVNDSINSITGELTKVQTLKKRDFQLFMKSLRKELAKNDIKIRYFACGEYGSQTQRPHYHAIIFGWKPSEDDLTLVDKSELGYELFSSKIIDEKWNKGHNIVAECTWETCAYVARYVTKKVDITNDFYEVNNIEKEFILMSRKPGIGLEWYEKNKDKYKDNINNYISTDFGSRKISHNRYFDSKLEAEEPELLQQLKKTREKFMKQKKKMTILSTDMPFYENLKVKERSLKSRTKALTRKEI